LCTLGRLSYSADILAEYQEQRLVIDNNTIENCPDIFLTVQQIECNFQVELINENRGKNTIFQTLDLDAIGEMLINAVKLLINADKLDYQNCYVGHLINSEMLQ